MRGELGGETIVHRQPVAFWGLLGERFLELPTRRMLLGPGTVDAGAIIVEFLLVFSDDLKGVSIQPAWRILEPRRRDQLIRRHRHGHGL
jgi:hypothetical protein